MNPKHFWTGETASPYTLAVVILGLLIYGISDFMQADEVQVIPQGECDPARVQVIHTDNSRQMTVVLDRGVNCVVVTGGL